MAKMAGILSFPSAFVARGEAAASLSNSGSRSHEKNYFANGRDGKLLSNSGSLKK